MRITLLIVGMILGLSLEMQTGLAQALDPDIEEVSQRFSIDLHPLLQGQIQLYNLSQFKPFNIVTGQYISTSGLFFWFRASSPGQLAIVAQNSKEDSVESEGIDISINLYTQEGTALTIADGAFNNGLYPEGTSFTIAQAGLYIIAVANYNDNSSEIPLKVNSAWIPWYYPEDDYLTLDQAQTVSGNSDEPVTGSLGTYDFYDWYKIEGSMQPSITNIYIQSENGMPLVVKGYEPGLFENEEGGWSTNLPLGQSDSLNNFNFGFGIPEFAEGSQSVLVIRSEGDGEPIYFRVSFPDEMRGSLEGTVNYTIQTEQYLRSVNGGRAN